MKWHQRQFSLSLNKDMPGATLPAAPRVLPTTDALTEISVLSEHISWNYHGSLTGLYLKASGDVWKANVKVELGSGPAVAYLISDSLLELVQDLHEYAKKGLLDFHPDRYPNKLAKRKGVYRRPYPS